jgi:uncharacterized Zn-binding protein involved in type VI secretion
MGAPAAVMGDKIVGMCPIHQTIAPTGNPVPAPPMPFSASITFGVATKTFIEGKPAVVVGANGLNVPPHVGLHASDPFMAPPMQKGTVVSGSTSVFIEGKPAASAASQCTMCATPAASLVATGVSVLIG